MSKYWDTGYFSQPTERELKANMAQSLKKAEKKGESFEPVIVEGRTIAKSWWGRSWCENLERYADYSSRIERGKRYVRSGTVIDLKIKKSKVAARVQGSRKTPYKVEIQISPLSEERCQDIIDKCSRKLETIEELVSGSFPEEMKELFTQDGGLFPTPREISFRCSCPDWAIMCKHVAAVLYGIAVRLDEDPALFFELRGIDMKKFIDVTIANRVEMMLRNAEKPSSRIIDDAEVMRLFGV